MDIYRTHCMKLIVAFFALFCWTQAHAQDQAQQQEQPKSDPIVEFVGADYAERYALIKDWPYDAEVFDRLIQLMESETLLTDAEGKVYILENDVDLVDYSSGKSVGDDWPESIDTVSLNNSLRSVIQAREHLKNLNSDSDEVRLNALVELSDTPDSVSVDVLQNKLASETKADIKDRLQMLIARKQLDSDNPEAQLNAVAVLRESSNPEVLALISSVLSTPDISPELKTALTKAQASVEGRISRIEWVGHGFSGLSMASVLLLAALGLAITYGLLGVINMAHGELIMIGAYATYVTQSAVSQWAPAFGEYYLLLAIPMAFIVSALVGVIIERLVVKPLYGRQLETLLATFGVSLILIQVTRMIFGAQNVAVESVGWLSGGIPLSASVILPYNRIAIIVFTLVVLLCIKLLIEKTRFGLFVRAVTQNRGMARAVGVRSSRVDMMAFGLGSGIAGLAGCALAQIGNVGPDLGQNLIVDTFLVVVVGGVGQLAGAALASLGLGVGGTFLEVGIGAVLAKIALLVLVILFIQKRPQGLFQVKGRFVDQ